MKGPTNSSARPNIRLLNVSATFESNPDTSNNLEFPYRASIQADGVSEYMSATVMFSQIQAISGNFATYCQTGEDVVYIYSKTDAGTITIPAVSCDLSVNYINVDNVPTEDSQAVITSGGVYTALDGKLSKVPMARLYNASGSFGYNGGDVTTITCSSADTNDISVFTATSGQNKIVCKKTGYYLITYSLHGRCSTTGRKEVSVIVGSDVEAAYGIQYEEETSNNNTMCATVILYITANSDVQLGGYFSNSSGTFSIANKSTYLHIAYLGS